MKTVLIALAFAAASQSAPQDATRNADGWLALDEESNLDGARSYIAAKESLEPVLNSIGRPERPSLAVACMNGETSVALSWPSYLGRDEVWVDASVDRGEVHRWTFYIPQRSPRLATFGGSGNWRRFTNATADGERITFRVHAYRGSQEATFELAGLEAVMRTAAETCST